MTADPNPGMLFLVVGPSGVGKDSIIDGVKARLAGDDSVVFPKRAITRSKDSGGEDHRPLTERAFEAENAAGLFALTWQAHDLSYGIPQTIDDDLKAGRSVIVNVSRGIIDEARRRYESLRVISVTASPDVIAERLRSRGRETEADIQSRIERAQAYRVSGRDVIEIANNGELDAAVSAFIAIIRSHSGC